MIDLDFTLLVAVLNTQLYVLAERLTFLLLCLRKHIELVRNSAKLEKNKKFYVDTVQIGVMLYQLNSHFSVLE